MIGETLGSYEVREQIGEGGMGEVYLARHKHIERKAAIKVLRSQYSADAELVARFFSEARSANLVKHDGIVEIYDCAVHTDGRAFIVMEYLEGQTLGAALERLGCVDEVMTMVDLSWQIATALQAAHDKGIIHRDLKPDNIFLTFVENHGPSPVVKILDFGIAKLMHSTVKATQTGSLLGTPLYMSPEQGRGSGVVGHRTDIYSLGCIMFEMVTGRPPFVREGAGELIVAHASEMPPPASKIKPRLPPEIDQLIGSMLSKRPEDRPQSMQDVANVLNMFRAHKSTVDSTAPFIGELDDGSTSQFQRQSPSIVESPSLEAKARPRRVAPTEILPPSDRESRSPGSVIQTPMAAQHSWIIRAQQTSGEPRRKRPMVRERPASGRSDRPSRKKEELPSAGGRSVLLRSLGFGAIGGVAILAVFYFAASSRSKPESKGETTTAASPEDVTASVAPPPLAQNPPASPPPAPAPVAQPAPAHPPAAAEQEKAKRPSHHAPAGSATGAGADALASGLQSFKAGDYIAAGIQAKKAVRQGAGVRAYLLLGDSMIRLQSYADAQQAYQSALEIDPSSGRARHGLRLAKQKASQ